MNQPFDDSLRNPCFSCYPLNRLVNYVTNPLSSNPSRADRLSPLRVLVVDDTALYRKIVKDVLAHEDGIEVVGTAFDGKAALDRIAQLKPDLLTLDLEMPNLDGLGVLRELKKLDHPIGAIMLSAFTTAAAGPTVEALRLGAFDFVLKPSTGGPAESLAELRSNLIPKIKAFASRRVSRSNVAATTTTAMPPALRPATVRPFSLPPEVIGIGISTGGPDALNVLMPSLPASLPAPVMIVQHMPPMFTKSLADDLNLRCALTVAEATDGMKVLPGMAVIAPGGKQMKLVRTGGVLCARITDDPAEGACKPAVDYLFRSLAEVCGNRTLAVIMTGMGNDGTAACRLLRTAGARILVQDEASCVVYGMPRGPVEEGTADEVVSLSAMAAAIQSNARVRKAA